MVSSPKSALEDALPPKPTYKQAEDHTIAEPLTRCKDRSAVLSEAVNLGAQAHRHRKVGGRQHHFLPLGLLCPPANKRSKDKVH
eukprot:1142851-Pelagomonas_calceolata.AAC.3